MTEGHTFLETRDHEQALESFRRAADLYGQIGDRKRQAEGLYTAGGIFALLDRTDEALAAFSGVIDLLREEAEPRKRAMAWTNKGLILVRQQRFQEALGCFEEALVLFKQGDEPIRVAEQWGNIGSVYRDLEQPDGRSKTTSRRLPFTANSATRSGPRTSARTSLTPASCSRTTRTP